MIWKGTHLSIGGLTADNVYQSKNQAMGLKELPAELGGKIMSRHRSGEGYQRSSAELKVPKSTVTAIFLKWKKSGTTRLFLELAGQPNLMVILAELQRSCLEMRKTSRRTTTTATLQ